MNFLDPQIRSVIQDETVKSQGKKKRPPWAPRNRRAHVYGFVMAESMDPSTIFPERLRRARELRQLSQAELATRARLQPSAVSHFETGARRPSFDNLRRLADALQVSTDYLVGRTESPGGEASADILFRDIERLSTNDRELASKIIAELTARNRGREGSGSGT